MASIRFHRNRHGGQGTRILEGPIFDDTTDPLDLVEEIMDLPPNHSRSLGVENTDQFARDLVQLDIARSLRLIADSTGVQSFHGRYGTQHKRRVPFPDWWPKAQQ